MTGNDYGLAYQAGFMPTIRFLLSRGIPLAAAEETAQAAWTRGWERIDQLRDKELLPTWVNTIAVNMYRHAARKASRHEPLFDRTGGIGIDMAAIDLARLLKGCCASDRVLLLLHLHGLTTGEIAREIGTTETAVRVRLTRARRSARALIQSRAGSRH